MQPQGERSTPIHMHTQGSESPIPDLDSQGEVIDKGGVPRLPGAFGDYFEAVEATETSAPVPPSQHQPKPVASPPGFETTRPPVGDDDLNSTQPSNDEPISHQARSRPDFETQSLPVGYEELTGPPEGDEPLPTPAQRRARRRQAEWNSVPHPSCSVQPEMPQFFTEILNRRTSSGAKFTLRDGNPLRSSLRKKGERVSAQIVRWAFWKVQDHYKHRGLYYRRPRIPRVQLLALRFSEVLAIQDLVYPGISCMDLRLEAMTALSAVLDGLEKFDDAEK